MRRRAFGIWWWWKRAHAGPVCTQFTLESGATWDTLTDAAIADATGYVLTLLSGPAPELSYWDGADWQLIGTIDTNYTSEHDRLHLVSTGHDAAEIEYCTG